MKPLRPPTGLDLVRSDTLPTLEERAKARIQERATVRRLKHGIHAFPKDEHKDRHRAMVLFATMPTKTLMAVYKAALQFIENENTP